MQKTFTLTLGDMGTITGIVVAVVGLLWFVLRQQIAKVTADVALEMVKSENRITEKIKLQFAQKEITDLQLKDLQKDIEELKKNNNH